MEAVAGSRPRVGEEGKTIMKPERTLRSRRTSAGQHLVPSTVAKIMKAFRPHSVSSKALAGENVPPCRAGPAEAAHPRRNLRDRARLWLFLNGTDRIPSRPEMYFRPSASSIVSSSSPTNFAPGDVLWAWGGESSATENTRAQRKTKEKYRG